MVSKEEFEAYKKQMRTLCGILFVMIGILTLCVGAGGVVFFSSNDYIHEQIATLHAVDYNTANAVMVYYDEFDDFRYDFEQMEKEQLEFMYGVSVMSALQGGIIDSIDGCCNTTPLRKVQSRWD